MINRNIGVCTICGDIIESTHVHDMAWCGCGKSFVDGGREYVRAGGSVKTFDALEDAALLSGWIIDSASKGTP